MAESRNAKAVLDFCVKIGILSADQRAEARILRSFAGPNQLAEGYVSWAVDAPHMRTDIASYHTLAEIAKGVRAGVAWAAENGLTGASGWCLYPHRTGAYKPESSWRGGWLG